MQDADTRNGREIDAENAAGFFTQGDGSGRRHYLAFFHRIPGGWQGGCGVSFRFEAFHQPLHFFLTGGDPSLILAIHGNGLSQREQVLLPVISDQAFRNGFVAGSNPGMT